MRKAITLILVTVVLSPLFGVIGADLVGYHEPLDLVAERLGLEERRIWEGILPDYQVPGLSPVLGYVISGLVGVGILLLPLVVRRMASRERNYNGP